MTIGVVAGMVMVGCAGMTIGVVAGMVETFVAMPAETFVAMPTKVGNYIVTIPAKAGIH